MQTPDAHPGFIIHGKWKRRGLLRWAGGFDQDILASKGHGRGNRSNARDGGKLQPDALGGSIEPQAGDHPFTERSAVQLCFACRLRQYLLVGTAPVRAHPC